MSSKYFSPLGLSKPLMVDKDMQINVFILDLVFNEFCISCGYKRNPGT